jgi:hypothetical protein
MPKAGMWRGPDPESYLVRRPLLGSCRSHLNGGNRRKAERLVVRALMIRRDVIWPKDTGPLRSGQGGEADILRASDECHR